MRTTIAIEGTDVRVTLSPDTEIEKLVIQELSDDISISRSHQSLVLKRRASHIRKIDDEAFGEAETIESAG